MPPPKNKKVILNLSPKRQTTVFAVLERVLKFQKLKELFMKRAISILLVLLLFSAFAVPAAALGEEVMVYTQESSFTVGGTVSIDWNKTLISIYNDGLSDEYNSYLEGNVQYYWMRNGSYYADGMTLTITENDRGCEFYCMAALYTRFFSSLLWAVSLVENDTQSFSTSLPTPSSVGRSGKSDLS